MHIKGQGVSKDDAEAAKWCGKASEQGNAKAQMLLGAMYHNGEGVPRDYVQALKWLTLADAGFSPSETAHRETVGSLLMMVRAGMTELQKAEAQRQARAWKPGAGPAYR
jgi:TPR repeat protein